MKKKSNLISLEKHLDSRYGKKGTVSRNQFEEGYQHFKINVLLKEARKKANLTQEELARRAKTKKSYISRLENKWADIRLSTLKRIIEEGLGGKLIIHFELPSK